jgi:type IV pilus assembly protein PilB
LPTEIIAMAKARGDFTGILVQKKIISPEQLVEARTLQQQTGARLQDVIVKLGFASTEEVVAAIAEFHGLEFINLTEVTIPQAVIELVPESVARENIVIPMDLDGTLRIIMSDPTDSDTILKLQFILNMDIQPILAPREQIIEAINRHYGQTETENVPALLQEFTDLAIDFDESAAASAPAAQDDSSPEIVKLVNLIIEEAIPKAGEAMPAPEGKEESIPDIINSLADDMPRQHEASIDLGSLMELQDAAPVRKLVNMVMLLAIKDKASDIHFEPFEDEFKMRYRCDGTLYEMVPPPRHLAPEVADRIKVMANLDTAERRLPQYGRIDLNVGGNPVPMRVSVLPTMFGESVAIRVLDHTVLGLDLNRVGMDPALLGQFREIIHKPKPNGIVLVTGPTGAGKTTTLYSALNELNEITDKIITAEDPVEYDIDGIVRCQIHDLTFANALQSILGQDPDIIVVGAIRDHETAQIAVQAALSGRLVLSTLDAHDAPSSITRLRGMGLEPSLIAATVKAILAQRLVRKICEHCRAEFEPTPDMLMELNLRPADVKGKKFYYGQGCDRCNNTGHRGRCGIFELAVMNDELRDIISSGASTDQLRTACWGQGMTTLREAGLKALASGVTTIEEVARETVLVDRT